MTPAPAPAAAPGWIPWVSAVIVACTSVGATVTMISRMADKMLALTHAVERLTWVHKHAGLLPPSDQGKDGPGG